MTQEQWLVYIWSIYPNGGGGWSFMWAVGLICVLIFLLINFLIYNDSYKEDNKKDSPHYYEKTTWYVLGRWKWIIPSILATFLFLSSLVPSKEGFMYILATPYVVDSDKNIIEDLKDENSKVSKLNKLLDKSLDKALKEGEK